MIILGIDTACRSCSAAVTKDGKLLSEIYFNQGLTHSETSLPAVKSALSTAGITLADVDGFAVTAGPGSFTGLRIGLSLVKGLALPLDKPCAAVSTLEALSFMGEGFDGVIVPALDARCRQVYTAAFRSDPFGRDGKGCGIFRLSGDAGISLDEECEIIKKCEFPVFLVGDGAELCYNTLSDRFPADFLREKVLLAPPHLRYLHAGALCRAAEKHFADNDGSVVSADALIPAYLRIPQAERELKAKMAAKAKESGK